MSLFRWIDSGCQEVACYYQYVEPDAAAELRNVNRMLGKICALFCLSMRMLAYTREPEQAPAQAQHGAASRVQVTKGDVVRATLLLATLESINSAVFRRGARIPTREELATARDEDLDRLLLARVIAPRAVSAWSQRHIPASVAGAVAVQSAEARKDHQSLQSHDLG